MKKTKFKKLLLTLTVLVVLGAGGAYFGAKQLLKRRAMVWRRDGIAASIAGQHERAAFYLGGYLRRFPENTPATTEALKYYVVSRELAELPNGQHYAETIAALKTLVGREGKTPEGLEFRRHLLELYVKLGQTPEALPRRQ